MRSPMMFGERWQTGVRDRTTLVILVLASMIAPVSALAQPGFEDKLVPSGAVAGERFGASAVSDNTAVVSGSGGVYVFERDSNTGIWTESVRLLAPGSGISFGGSVAIDGDLIVVGVPDHAVTGRAYVYGRNQGGSGSWGYVTSLIPHDDGLEADVDEFGASVAISGGTAIVGAPISRVAPVGLFQGVVGPGAAYIFEKDYPSPGAWGEVANIVGKNGFDPCFGDRPCPFPIPIYVDLFGSSVDISGDTVVVGAVQPISLGDFNSGAAYIFARNQGGSGQWGRVTELRLPRWVWDTPSSSRVAISGDTAIVGAVGPGGPAGIFERDHGGPNAWGRVAERDGNGCCGDSGSTHVDIDGDYAVLSNASAAPSANFIRVLSRNSGGSNVWGLYAEVRAADLYGYPLAIDGQTLLANTTNTTEHLVYACRLDVLPNPDSACLLTKLVVNPLVSAIVTATSCCGPLLSEPIYAITARFTNSSTTALRNVFFEVVELSGGNLLLGRDSDLDRRAVTGLGATLTPDLVASGGDELLSPGESVTVTFNIVLAARVPFRFVINTRGDPQP